jgi:uncharacterized protein YfaS (alpha-2-macroglobulin family)
MLSERHLYEPSNPVKVNCHVSGEMRDEAKSDSVTVKLVDANGSTMTNRRAKRNSKGENTTSLKLPASAQGGKYSTGLSWKSKQAKVDCLAHRLWMS